MLPAPGSVYNANTGKLPMISALLGDTVAGAARTRNKKIPKTGDFASGYLFDIPLDGERRSFEKRAQQGVRDGRSQCLRRCPMPVTCDREAWASCAACEIVMHLLQ